MMTRQRFVLPIVIGAAACTSERVSSDRATLVTTARPTFFHAGFGAGPILFSNAAGALMEERRHEPFGQPIGAADVVARDLNVLNQRTDAATGWSDHGARWMAPQTAGWLTPDPLVMGPEVRLMSAPWQLHPYQYTNQNPVAYWDPDGRQGVPVGAESQAFTRAVAAVTQDRSRAASPDGTANIAPPAPPPAPPAPIDPARDAFEQVRQERTYEGMTRYASFQPGGGLVGWVFSGQGAATRDVTVGFQAGVTAFVGPVGGTAGVNYQVFHGPGGGYEGTYTTTSTSIRGTAGISVSAGVNAGFKVTSFAEWQTLNGFALNNLRGGAEQWPGVFHQAAVGYGPVSVGAYAGDGWGKSNQWIGVSVDGSIGLPAASVSGGDVDYEER